MFFLVSFKYFPTRVLRRMFVWIPVQMLPSHWDDFSGMLQRKEFLFAGSIKMCLTPKPPALIVILRKWLLSSDSESTGCSYSSQSIQCCRKKQVFTKIVSFASKKFQKWGAQNTQYKRSGPLLAVILGQTTVSFLVSLLRKKKESDCCLAWVRGGIGIWRRTLWLVSFHVLKRWMWYRRETCSNTQNILH